VPAGERYAGARKGEGNRGGVRTINCWAVDDELCSMVYMYAKNEQRDLSPTQIRAVARVVREEFK
jgi:hypothetical protein